ncbi:segregation/condensation protein A [Enterococcus dongliensis]|uniref:Segregation and condensation protein A n=1 Tax=Enterococcus dongliensis TaxID=2559925 RepID=A0AAP5U0S3_9ENTE|nr:segregation/condensation protein A [Enterococcus dongliensis]MDT2596071.1 segregation/condensation protein A [Enterococcus dongliensis]MDT2603513.1 segregation/condensation protein A [Enterococcus dongliensis]MDT2635277.1 segregation/condensation protein A [Enterococcus dongliensis]MDT2636925.1 segregation/condensation protein A [Enterococcus dongliensis]MDT2641981.1 segregation/condensation protein A [Enterococcus dongliensis]
METISLKLDVFEGPLDLLLHLIQQLEIDIYDIPIADVTGQYLNFIHAMKTLELEVAGEYLVMAATLMSIKSQMLLPKPELEFDYVDDEGEDPRDALVQQLLEYRKYKYAASVLSEKEQERSLFYTKAPMDLSEYEEEIPPLPKNQLNTIDLFLALHDVLKRKRQEEPVETTIVNESITVDQKVTEIDQRLAGLSEDEGLPLESLLVRYTKDELITTFMALLELMKKGRALAAQTETYAPILIYKGVVV